MSGGAEAWLVGLAHTAAARTACSATTARSISWCQLPTCIAGGHGSLHDNDLSAAGEGRVQGVEAVVCTHTGG